jgi:hypothetical protein
MPTNVYLSTSTYRPSSSKLPASTEWCIGVSLDSGVQGVVANWGNHRRGCVVGFS